MQTLSYSIQINASKEKVWEIMLGKPTYEQWTKPFNQTSTFHGDWSQDSKMIFLGTDPETGEEGGMVSLIDERRECEFISLKHIGEYKSGQENVWGEDKHSFENYSFLEKDGSMQVLVEMADIPTEWVDWMNDLWPKALEELKKLCEQ